MMITKNQSKYYLLVLHKKNLFTKINGFYFSLNYVKTLSVITTVSQYDLIQIKVQYLIFVSDHC